MKTNGHGLDKARVGIAADSSAHVSTSASSARPSRRPWRQVASCHPVPPCSPHRLAIALALGLGAVSAVASPQGGVVITGNATIDQTGTVTTIEQSTQKASINWTSFSVAADETVQFVQPSSSAITLNRVIGNEASIIEGALKANGQVFILNSNGVLFTQGSTVSVGGLVASTLNLSDADFLAGHYSFASTGSTASVVNEGSITAATGGYIALLATTVQNTGTLTAEQGTVALAAADAVTLDLSGDQLLGVTLDTGALQALVDNQGAIVADGGRILLTAKALDELTGAQVNNSGILQARTVGELQGEIELMAEDGTTTVGGTLDASAPDGGDGGFIETSGTSVQVAEGAVITTAAASGSTGTWLIDPDGFTIGTGGDMTATALSQALASSNVVIESTQGSGSDGDVKVNDAVSWDANTTLTLEATNDILINADITATGTSAGLVLEAGGDYQIDTSAGASVTLSGADASLTINGQAYTLIHSMADLEAIDNHWGLADGYYALAEDLDASSTTYTAAVVTELSGTLAGLGHTISNLTIATTTTDWTYGVGLIGTADATAVVRDIGVVNVDVYGVESVGALVGVNTGTISNAYSTGTVSGNYTTGGLVGDNLGGTITDSYSEASVIGASVYTEGWSFLGGLVGRMSDGTLTNSYATGDVTVITTNQNVSATYIGGLAGAAMYSTVDNCYATGDVTGGGWVGGLAGYSTGPISDSYATGDVTATNSYSGYAYAGGLVGENGDGGVITGSYATGDVVGGTDQGGLVGINSGSISDSYATGNVGVEGDYRFASGGLVGNNGGEISNSYATGDVLGGSASGGLAGTNSGTISDSYATGNVTGYDRSGGLVGVNQGDISGSTASGDVTLTGDASYASNGAGGLVGSNLASGTIDSSTATGSVSGGASGSGQLTGSNAGTVTNSSYHDVARIDAATQVAAGDTSQTARSAQVDAQSLDSSTRATASGAESQGVRLSALDSLLQVQDTTSYSAAVRRIEVDGKVYEVEDDSPGAAARPPATQASSGAAAR
jgi:filamentous hemagglutinin family protein